MDLAENIIATVTVFVNRIGGLLQIGQPADFFASERSRNTLHGLSVAGAFALCCAPFLSWVHDAPLTTWQQEFWAFLAGILMMAALLRSAEWRSSRVSLALLFPLSMLCLVGAQAAIGSFVVPSVFWLVSLEMAWVIGVMLAVSAINVQTLMRAVGFGLIAAGLIGGVLGMVQSARLPALADRSMFYAQDGLAYGFLAQRNLFADVQFMALLSLIFVVPVPATRVARLLRWLVLGLLSSSAALSGSNALVAQFAVALPLTVLWNRRDPVLARRLRRGLLVALVVMVATYGLRAGAGGVSHVAGVSVLGTLWTQALHAITAHPWTGIGLGNTPTVFYAFAASLPQTASWHAFHAQGWANVHNLVLQLWLEGGIVGLVIALGLYGALACGWMRARTSTELFAASLLTVLLVHSLVEFPLWNLPFLGIAALCLVVVLPSKMVRMPSVAALAPVAMMGVMGLAVALALQMNARVGVLQQVAQITFNPTQIGTVASVARTLDAARTWSGVTGLLLEPAAVYETAAFSPQIVPRVEWPDYAQQLDRTMHLTPVGSIPYANAYLIAYLRSVPEGIAAMREAQAAVPGPARIWRKLLSAQSHRGDAVALRLLKSLSSHPVSAP